MARSEVANEVRRQRSRAALVRSAGQVFVRKGFHDTLISDIVGEAKVGQGTFYRYFKDKRSVLDELFAQFTEELFAGFAEMSARLPTNHAEYRAYSIKALKQVAEALEKNRDLALFFIRKAPGIDAAFEEKIHTLYDQFAQLAQMYLDHAIAHGFARPCRSAIVARSLVGIAVGMATEWWSGRITGVSVDEFIEELVDLGMYGFGAERKTA